MRELPKAISQTRSNFEPVQETYLDLDSHANTCVLGSNALLVETAHPPRSADVSFADPALGSVSKPILSGAFKYTTPSNGQSFILVGLERHYLAFPIIVLSFNLLDITMKCLV